MNSFIIKAVAETIEYINQNDYWVVYILILVINAIGCLISWFLSKRKLHSEIKKLEVEITDKQSQLLEKMHKYRDKHVENSKLIELSIRDVLECLRKKDSDLLRQAWLELNSFFFNDLLASFNGYLEMVEILFEKDRKRKKYFIEDQIFRLFKTIELYLAVVNKETILSRINHDKISISKETITPMMRFVRDNTGLWQLRKRITLKKYLKKFGC